jgi:hypothetical protein
LFNGFCRLGRQTTRKKQADKRTSQKQQINEEKQNRKTEKCAKCNHVQEKGKKTFLPSEI